MNRTKKPSKFWISFWATKKNQNKIDVYKAVWQNYRPKEMKTIKITLLSLKSEVTKR